MVRKVDEDEKVVNNVCTLGGVQKALFLTEDGLYEVLMQSRKPIAKQFKKEVKTTLTISYSGRRRKAGTHILCRRKRLYIIHIPVVLLR